VFSVRQELNFYVLCRRNLTSVVLVQVVDYRHLIVEDRVR